MVTDYGGSRRVLSCDRRNGHLSVETRPSHRSARSGVCARPGGDGDHGSGASRDRSAHGPALPGSRPEPGTARLPPHRGHSPTRARPHGGEDRASLPRGAVSVWGDVAVGLRLLGSACRTPTASSESRCRTTRPRSIRWAARSRSGICDRETSSSSAVSVTWGSRSAEGDTSTRLSRASGSRSRRSASRSGSIVGARRLS